MRLAVDSPRPDNAAWFAAEVLPHEALLRGWLRARFPALPILDDIVQETLDKFNQHGLHLAAEIHPEVDK